MLNQRPSTGLQGKEPGQHPSESTPNTGHDHCPPKGGHNPVSTNRQIDDKHEEVHPYPGVLLSREKEQGSDSRYIDGGEGAQGRAASPTLAETHRKS